jgi:hypothetical protein
MLGRCLLQLRKSFSRANMAYSRAERVPILEHHLTLESFAAIREKFRNSNPGMEELSKTGNRISEHRKCLRQETCPTLDSVDR